MSGSRPARLGGEPMGSSRPDSLPRRPPAVARLSILLAVVSALGAARASSAAGEGEGRMAAIIAALRTEEAKYRELEYTLRIATRKSAPEDPAGPGEVTSEETRRVVLQGDRVWFRGVTSGRAFKTDLRREEVSAYDGERTRTVAYGNCANVHLGRFEHPDVYPAH